MTTREAVLMKNAAEFLARWLHRDQEDLQGEPYVGHLERVARYTKDQGGTPEQVAAAWLHDSIEDGHIGIGALRAIFPPGVADKVWDLSRDKAGGESYSAYIDRLISDPRARRALLVKIADLKDNMDRSRGPAPERLIRRYEETMLKIEEAIERRTA